jgi:hypothetical protein
MADHLLADGCMEAAPSLAGAVLEDGLRRIAKNHNVTVRKDSDNIVSLNTKLAQARVYSSFVQKKVSLWNDIRNNADHGKFEELHAIKQEEIVQMIAGVRDFLGTYLQ